MRASYPPPLPAALSPEPGEEQGFSVATPTDDARPEPITWRHRLPPRVRRMVYILETRDVNVIDRILFWSAVFWVLAALWEA
jgi:hypothetical protein